MQPVRGARKRAGKQWDPSWRGTPSCSLTAYSLRGGRLWGHLARALEPKAELPVGGGRACIGSGVTPISSSARAGHLQGAPKCLSIMEAPRNEGEERPRTGGEENQNRPKESARLGRSAAGESGHSAPAPLRAARPDAAQTWRRLCAENSPRSSRPGPGSQTKPPVSAFGPDSAAESGPTAAARSVH